MVWRFEEYRKLMSRNLLYFLFEVKVLREMTYMINLYSNIDRAGRKLDLGREHE